MNRSWQRKRIVITKEIIAIGRVDDGTETVVDAIPFADIVSVREMLGEDESRIESDQGKFINAFLITTVSDGYNSGRTYYFQTSSKGEYNNLTRHLHRNTKAARKQAEFNTRFTRSQYVLRKFFNSWMFQYFSAFLIILVLLALSPSLTMQPDLKFSHTSTSVIQGYCQPSLIWPRRRTSW